MITLKEQYSRAKNDAIEFMNKGLIHEYIEQLKFANNLRVEMIQCKK